MKKLFSLKTAILAFAVFALVGFAFSSSKAYAEDADPVKPVTALGADVTAKYDASKDVIEISTTKESGVTVQILKFKDDQPASIKKAASEVEVKSTTPSAVSLTSKDGGIKMAVTKDTYLMIATGFVDKETTGEVPADIKIGATKVKKLSMELNYAVAADKVSTSAVASLSITKTESSSQAQDVKEADFKYYEYAVKYKQADAPTEYQPLNELTGGVLYDIMSNEDKADILVRAKGTDASTLPSKEGVRPSAAKKISVKKPGKLATVKYATKTGLLAIKNGYDFCVMTSTPSAIELDKWVTIIRTNKNGTAKSEYADCGEYVPAKFADGKTADKYTTTKLKGVTFETLVGKYNGVKTSATVNTDEGFFVYVRKSATEKAPASKVELDKGYYFVNPETKAPTLEKNDKGEAVTTSGASVKIKFKKDVDDNTPEASVVFEYAVVKKDDIDKDKVKMDSLTWKAFKGAELTVKAATKKTSKYLLSPAKEADKAKAYDTKLADCYILVRRQAALSDKAGKIKDQGLSVYQPSDYVKVEFTVVKDSKKDVITDCKVVEAPVAPVA